MKNLHARVLSKKSHIFFLSAVIGVMLVLSAYIYYSHITQKMREEKENDLKAIAELKINQFLRWHEERTGDANVISNDLLFINEIQKWLRNKSNDELIKSISHKLSVPQKEYGYKSIFISSIEGKLLLSLDSNVSGIDPSTKGKIIESVSKGKNFFTDFYFSKSDRLIYYDIITPLKDNYNKTIAVLLFRVDPNKYIYPFMQSWPMPSQSAETLILKQEGDSVLFLNELKHKKDTALKFKLPLSKVDLPAVQVVKGNKGIFEGKDYRGIDVLAYLTPVPGTGWYMVAKIDEDEIFAELKYRVFAIGVFIAVLIISLTIGLAWIYHYRQKNIYKNLWEAQEEYKIILHSIGDAVITTDKLSRVTFLNPVAENLTGWKNHDAINKPLVLVFNIINEDTRNAVENPVERVLKDGLIVGLANHTLLISKDGRETPIADSGAPIKDESGNIVGVVLVFRDKTEERDAYQKIQESEKRYRTLFQSIRDAILVADTERNIIDCNNAFSYMFGYSLEEIRGKKTLTVYENEEQFIELGKAIKAHFGDKPFNYTVNYKRKDNTVFPGKTAVFYLRDSDNNVTGFIGLIRDITERIKTDTALRESHRKFNTMIDNLSGVVYRCANDYDWTMEYISDAVFNLTGYPASDFLNNNVRTYNSIIHVDDQKRIWDEIQSALSQKSPYTIEYQIITNEGKIKWVWERGRGVFDSGKLIALEGFIQDITERKQAEKEIIHLNRLYAMLSQSNQAIVRVKDRDHLFKSICRVAIEYGEFKLAWIGLFNLVSNKIEPYVWYGDDKGFIQTELMTAPEEMRNLMPCFRAYKENRVVVINNVETEPDCEYWRSAVLERNFKSLAATPIHFNGSAIGTIVLYSSEVGFFGDKEITLLEEVGSDISFALETFDREKKRQLAEKERILLYDTMEKSVNEIYIFDASSLKFRYINSGAINNLGYSFDELKEMTPLDIKPEFTQQSFSEIINPLINKEKDFQLFETVHRRKNGTVYPCEARLQVFEYEDDKVFLAVIQDITERKRIENNLKKSEAHFRSVWENSTDGMRLTDRNGIIVDVNNSYCRLMNKDRSELIGTNFLLVYDDKSLDDLQKYKERFRNGTIKPKLEAKVILWNGEEKWISLSNSFIKLEGKTSLLLSIFRDITDQKMHENELMIAKVKAESSEKMKSEFLAQMSHEIRTPLNALMSYTAYLREEVLADQSIVYEDIFNGISNSGLRIIRTIDLILNASELQAGVYDVIPRSIDIYNDIVTKVHHDLKRYAEVRGVDLRITNNAGDTTITCDEYSVYQSIINLTDNAIKYTENGYVEIRLARNNNNCLQIEIEDTGIGISEEFLEHLFEPFSQEETGYSRRFEGTGLGLSLVKKYCEINNIRTDVESKKNVGTKFTLTFPD